VYGIAEKTVVGGGVAREGEARGDAIGGVGFREGRGKGGGREVASCWEGLQPAQTVASVLSKQGEKEGVHWRSYAAWPGRVFANHKSHSFGRSTGSDQGDGDVTKTHLVFLFPVKNIFHPAKAVT
jgi:hypothetical protein